MGFVEVLLDTLVNYSLLSVLCLSTFLCLSRCVYRITLHPLAHIPGPLIWKISTIWPYYHSHIGDETTVIHAAARARYGPPVRVSPYEVDISDVDAVNPIYVSKGGFLEAPYYANFDIDGHSTIFSTLDPGYRALRAKGVVPMFSTKNIRDNEVALYGCVDRMAERMQEEAKTGRPVNILTISRSLAVDAVSTYLFQENCDGTSEKVKTLSVSASVDAFVAVR
ncbi:hypothetical protein WAI453_007719 [Rhynchosporium graminicola]|uniref:Related to benzoate 4-monooxygenase cytochrome P450 n=1 Tax=Rhynchosporium graminicola TaxID=2792576 RepID=A0A1E1L2K1_9HELO|nr:related to benzoate 4-monooxygenase cytochrome P450 [Rhynchosporium commune]